VKGTNSENKPWRLGINKPVAGEESRELFTVIDIEDQSMATSGNYQNYYFVDDKLIGHTIDPRTGKPIISNLKSVSVLHEQCAIADAYATAFMVLGMDAVQIVEEDSSISAYFIYEDETDGELKGQFIE